MEINKSGCNYLVAFAFAALILSSMVAGAQRKLLDKDQVGSMETSESSSMEQPQQEDEEVLLVAVHGGRILRQVKTTNDYGTYDPSPTMAKPHFKDIPN